MNANLQYLKEKVFPFLRSMPTVEEAIDGEVGASAAILDFDEYIIDLKGKEITDQYSCGRTGCLAGWYVMLSEQEGRLQEDDIEALKDHWDEELLAAHFDIDCTEAGALFGSKGGGHREYGHHDTEEILNDREEYLDHLLLTAGK